MLVTGRKRRNVEIWRKPSFCSSKLISPCSYTPSITHGWYSANKLKNGNFFLDEHASTPTEYLLDNLTHKRDLTVTAVRDSYESLHRFGSSAKNATVSAVSCNEGRSVITYQYSRIKPCRKQTRAIVYKHFKDRKASRVRIVEHSIWKYFPHFSAKETVGGRLWDILAIQGKYRMWYIGSSVSFESLKSVVEYNKLLVSKMRPIQGWKKDYFETIKAVVNYLGYWALVDYLFIFIAALQVLLWNTFIAFLFFWIIALLLFSSFKSCSLSFCSYFPRAFTRDWVQKPNS